MKYILNEGCDEKLKKHNLSDVDAMVEALNESDDEEIECADCKVMYPKLGAFKVDSRWYCKECMDKLANDAETELVEDTHATMAKPEGDKIKAYNNALKYAKKDSLPYIYGYTNIAEGGKFFALDQPIKCTGSDCEKKFKSQYKNAGVVYVAYPDKSFMKEDCDKYDVVNHTNDELEVLDEGKIDPAPAEHDSQNPVAKEIKKDVAEYVEDEVMKQGEPKENSEDQLVEDIRHFDDFDTEIQSDELIPDDWRDVEWDDIELDSVDGEDFETVDKRSTRR